MKNYRKALLYVGISFAVLFLALLLSVFLFKDRIIQQFIAEANKQLNTPIKIREIDVSILEYFPQLSIVMRDVYVEDSHPGKYPLLTAQRLSFLMSPLEVYRGEYNVKGLSIEGSETNLKINSKGENNYTILKPSGPGTKTSSLKLVLEDVVLRGTKVYYLDIRSRQHMLFSSKDLQASIRTENDMYDIEADGEVTTDTLSIEGRSFLPGKNFQIESKLLYDDLRKILIIEPSIVKLPTAAFTVSGNYMWKEKSLIDIKIDAEDADIQSLLSLLPENVTSSVSRYKSKGDVYFSTHIKGEMTGKKSPALNIEFGFSNATIFHPDFKSQIEDADLKGAFSVKDLSRLKDATLSLRNVSAKLNDEPFTGSLTIVDFANPYVDGTFKGKVDAASLHGFYPIRGVSEVSGSLHADIALKGNVNLLKNKATAQQVSTQGTIDLNGLNFNYDEDRIRLTELSGNLQFSNNDLALSNVSGNLGNSDFVLNGFFKNIITFVLFENQPVGIETDLKSDFIDLDELFAVTYGSDTGKGEASTYQFDISKNVYLNFNCDVKRLKYKRFSGRKIKGDLLVKNKVAVSRNLALQTMGGNLTMSGIVDSNNPKAIDVVCTSRLIDINPDSVFYVFENFDQDFIQDKHLKGKVTADVNFELTLNQHLRLFPETLIADISAVIKNGELNNFDPLQGLNKYMDDEGLNRLRFADIKNDIHIENKTVYIPQMQVNSNVTDIRISGTHTFNQRIDYRLITPLRGKRNAADPVATSAVGLDEKGQSKLFLKITGTTDDYRIQYDTEAVKKKIITDIKEEVKDLKEAFRKKETQKKKEIELQEDDYFEWSE